VVSFGNVRCRSSFHPTSSELRESRRAAELILSETIRPRRVSRKRVGEDEREDFDLVLTELVEYRRVRRPLWDMGVTDSEPEVPRSDHRDGHSSDQPKISHDHSHISPLLSLKSKKLAEGPSLGTALCRVGCAVYGIFVGDSKGDILYLVHVFALASV